MKEKEKALLEKFLQTLVSKSVSKSLSILTQEYEELVNMAGVTEEEKMWIKRRIMKMAEDSCREFFTKTQTRLEPSESKSKK